MQCYAGLDVASGMSTTRNALERLEWVLVARQPGPQFLIVISGLRILHLVLV